MNTAVMLAFDYGTRKIGVAVGQTITRSASPLPALAARDGVPDWEQVAKLVESWKPQGFVVGLPLNMDGTESDMSARARKFARRLEGRFGKPSHCVDERLSSREARERDREQRAEAGRSLSARSPVDSIAAQVILEGWLAEQAHSPAGS